MLALMNQFQSKGEYKPNQEWCRCWIMGWQSDTTRIRMIKTLKKLLFKLGSNHATHHIKTFHLCRWTMLQVWNSGLWCQNDEASVHRNSEGPWSPPKPGAGLPEESRSPSAPHRHRGCPPHWPSVEPKSQTKTHTCVVCTPVKVVSHQGHLTVQGLY